MTPQAGYAPLPEHEMLELGEDDLDELQEGDPSRGPTTDPEFGLHGPVDPRYAAMDPRAQAAYPVQQGGYGPPGYGQDPYGGQPIQAPPRGADPYARTLPPDPADYQPGGASPYSGHPAAYAPQAAGVRGQRGPELGLEDGPTYVEEDARIRSAIEGSPAANGPRLMIIGGNNQGREYPLNRGDTSLGRGVDNHVILADIAVSRKHTLICFEGGQYVVRDLGSGNGTILNGRKVDSHPLSDGDELELGNTLIRFILPASPAAMRQLAHQETVVTGQDPRPAAAPAPLPGPLDESRRHPTEIAVPAKKPKTVRKPAKTKKEAVIGAPAPARGRVRKLLLFGTIGLVVLFGGMFGLKMLLKAREASQEQALQRAETDTAAEQAAKEFQEGNAELQAKNWEAARKHFLKVLTLAPTFDQAKRYADHAASEIQARDAMTAARKALTSKAYSAAREGLAKVPSISIYATEARDLKQKVDDQQLVDLLAKAKELKDAGQFVEALEQAKAAQDLAPTNPVAKELRDELGPLAERASKGKTVASRPVSSGTATRAPVRTSSASSATAASKASRPASSGSSRTPSGSGTSGAIKVSGAKGNEALARYKERAWKEAFDAAKEYAATQSGSKKKQAESLADAIRLVGLNWMRAEKAKTSAQAIQGYQQAMVHDRSVGSGGHHQSTLKDLIFKEARKEANTAFSRGNYSTAYSALKLALQYGPDDAVTRKLMENLEKKANELFTQAYTKRSTDIAFARKTWQQVLKMVPASSPTYQKAYKWLNQATPSYQDEDED